MVQARVRRNDARILAAGLDLIAAQGWSGLSLAAVGKAAGLSIRPVRDRFDSRGELAAAIWRESAGPALAAALTRSLTAAGLLGTPGEGKSMDAAEFEAAQESLARPSTELRAAADLAVVATFEPELHAAVAESLGTTIRQWLDPADAGSAERAAKRGYLVALGLGLLAAAHRPGLTELDLQPMWRRYAEVLVVERAAVALPEEPRPPHVDFLPFNTGDDITDALLRAAIDHLSQSGYEGAVINEVVRTAGYSEGAIFSRYPSKEALFLDAILRDQEIGLRGQREYLQRMEALHGVGIAEAIAIRGTMSPHDRRICVIDMEHARMTWHNTNLAEVEEERLQELARSVLAAEPNHPDFSDPAHLHAARAMGLGVSFLPLIVDTAWDLPYDVVTIPLAERMAAA